MSNPGLGVTVRKNNPKFRMSLWGAELDEHVIIDSTVVDTTQTPTSKIRPGTVVGKDTATGRYHEAADTANVTQATAASVTSAEAPDGDWTGITHTFEIGSIKFLVTTSSPDSTVGAQVTALNADPTFLQYFLASNSGGSLKVAALVPGAGTRIKVSSDLATAWPTDGTEQAYGADAEYRICLQEVRTADINGTAQNAGAPAARVGHFDESELIGLTAEAKAVMQRNGSIFD